MIKTPDYTKAMQDMMANMPVDTSSMKDAFRTQTLLSEKMARVALQAAERSTEISARWAKDSIARMGEMLAAKEQPADYAKAMNAFATAAAELAAEHMAAYAEVAKKVQMDTVDLMLTAGKNIAQDAQAAAQDVVSKPGRPAESAARSGGAKTDTNA